jgi:hypothetical protein
MRYKIEFTGRDFSKITEVIPKVITDGSKTVPLSEDQIDTILTHFLDDFLEKNKNSNNSSFIVNNYKDKPQELYQKLGDVNFFQGWVGVIWGEIDIKKGDLGELPEEIVPTEEYLELEITLQILSRFDLCSNGLTGKPFFLSTMLKENPELSDNFVPSNDSDSLFDFLLLFVYKQKLEEAYLKGYFRTYHRFEKNDDKFRGHIDVERHLKENCGLRNGKIAYSYRENSVNNFLNHLIVAAYSHLKKKYFSMVNSIFDSNIELKGIIDNLKLAINYPKYDIKKTIVKNLGIISHPYYVEYEELRKICLKILRNEEISIFDADRQKTDGILFYIPELWEKYLENRIIDGVKSQERIKIISDLKKNDYKITTLPDFVFFDNKEPYMILDAKFKEKWGDATFGGKNSFNEVLDDYNKCIRDMNSIAGHATGVIFPTNNDNAIGYNNISHNISEYNQEDRFYTFPIYVPYSDKYPQYDDWKNEFDKNLSPMLEKIEKTAEIEKKYKTALVEREELLASISTSKPSMLIDIISKQNEIKCIER